MKILKFIILLFLTSLVFSTKNAYAQNTFECIPTGMFGVICQVNTSNNFCLPDFEPKFTDGSSCSKFNNHNPVCVANIGPHVCQPKNQPPPTECYENCIQRNPPNECRGLPACQKSCVDICTGQGHDRSYCIEECHNNGNSTSGNTPESGMINFDQLINEIAGLSKTPDRFLKLTTLGGFLTGILPFLYGIAGIALLLFLIAGGFGYLTSAGDPKKMEAAKGMITAAVIGFVLVFVAFWLTQIVNFVFNLGTAIK